MAKDVEADIEPCQKVSNALMEWLSSSIPSSVHTLGSTRPEGLLRSSSHQSLTPPAEDKTSVIAQLQPLLQPSLRQDGLTWDETAPILAKLHIDFLRKAVATANIQPVIAKLKAAAYQRPAMRKLAPSENLQGLLLTCPEPVSPVKKLSSCTEALFEFVADDGHISASGSQDKFRCCAAAKKAAEEAGKNHLHDLALQLQEEAAKKREKEAARAREEEAAKKKEE